MSHTSTIIADMMRALLVVPLTLSSLAVSAHAASVPLAIDGGHVRANALRLRRAISEGVARSMLFRDLVTRLDTSDVIVYIEPDCRMPSSLDGRLTFMSSTGGRRYVMVRIACLLELRRTIATIGHELRHAVEIAEADSVVDDSTLARLYEKTGFASRVLRPSAGYDTHMAIEAGRQVWDELVQAAE